MPPRRTNGQYPSEEGVADGYAGGPPWRVTKPLVMVGGGAGELLSRHPVRTAITTSGPAISRPRVGFLERLFRCIEAAVFVQNFDLSRRGFMHQQNAGSRDRVLMAELGQCCPGGR